MSVWNFSLTTEELKANTQFFDSNETSSVSVLDWLSARYLLRSLTDSVIETCYDKVLDSFNGKKNIIHTLIKASTSEQLQTIIQILKVTQSDEIEKNNNKIMIANNEYQTSYFDLLSESSIFNICEYLSVTDISHFKCTCTFISLIALQLMNGHRIGVLNMNELIECKDYRFSTHFSINNKITENRIKQFAKHKSLMDTYSRRYNIPQKHLLLLVSTLTARNNYNESLLISTVIDRSENIFDESKVNRKGLFFVLDKRKVLTLNNTSKLKTMSQIHQPEKMKNYKVSLLQFYDANEQRIQNIQFLWYDINTKSSRIENYILNDLYSIYAIFYPQQPSEWCNKILYTLNKMKQFGSVSQSLINIHSNVVFDPNGCTESALKYPNFQTITFQINYSHPYFKSQRLGESTQLDRFYPFFENVNEFLQDQNEKYSLDCKIVANIDIVQKQVNYFQNSEECDTSLENISDYMLVYVTPKTTFQLIKNQISYKLNKIVPAKHIQIFKEQDFWSNNYYGTVNAARGQCEKEPLCKIIKWEIVPYDTLLRKEHKIHQISIYDHESDGQSIFALPYKKAAELNMDCTEFYEHSDDMKQDDTSTNNNSQFKLKVNLFLKQLMDILSHGMYGNYYKTLIDKYKSNYSFMIMNKHDQNNKEFICYDGNDEYVQCVQKTDNKGFFSWTSKNRNNLFMDFGDYNINIYVVKHMNYTNNDLYIPIIVRFCTLTSFQTDFMHSNSFNEIGYPIKIWISKESTTIEHILKQYFGGKYGNEFKYKTCWSRVGELSVDDVIYNKISQSSMNNKISKPSKNKMKWNQILVILAPLEKKTSFFSS